MPSTLDGLVIEPFEKLNRTVEEAVVKMLLAST
jgi:hypothetical protein